MQPGLKPSQNPDWDLNPCIWDLNLAKTHSLPTEITHLVSGLMKLRFLMSHCRKNSVRDKVMGKKWIYLERNTLHRVWAISEGEKGTGVWGLSVFIGVGSFIG